MVVEFIECDLHGHCKDACGNEYLNAGLDKYKIVEYIRNLYSTNDPMLLEKMQSLKALSRILKLFVIYYNNTTFAIKYQQTISDIIATTNLKTILSAIKLQQLPETLIVVSKLLKLPGHFQHTNKHIQSLSSILS